MHSFQPSRGRVFFEALCALGMSASFAGAWMQTHATALLGTAGIAALYAVVRLFDMRRPKPAASEEPQRIDFPPEAADIVVPMMPAEEPEAVGLSPEQLDPVDEATARSGSGRRSGGSRKGSGRRAKAPKAVKAVDPLPADETDSPWPMREEDEVEEGMNTGLTVEDEVAFPPEEDDSRSHIEPLFEPEPFARMPRRAFGRRGRL